MSVPEINELARRIARSDSEDAEEQRLIRDHLSTLRKRVQGEKAHDVRLRLDSALLLTEYMRQMDGIGGDEILRIISRLVASMDPYFNPAVTLRENRRGGSSSYHDGLETRPADLPVERGARSPRIDPEDGKEHELIEDMLLGEILVQFGTINSTHVCQALELQQVKRIHFGDALVELGAATRSDIQSAIAYQESLRRGNGEGSHLPSAPLPVLRPIRGDLKLVSDMMLGDLLVRMGRITPEQLEQGLRAQRAAGVRIGEALVQMGAASWKDVEEGLRIQSERRVSAL